MTSPAAQFIDETIKHPDWLRIIESGNSEETVRLANEQGYKCTLDDLKEAAANLLQPKGHTAEKSEPTQSEVENAASGLSDLEGELGYGDDTGYAALYGVAGAIMKM